MSRRCDWRRSGPVAPARTPSSLLPGLCAAHSELRREAAKRLPVKAARTRGCPYRLRLSHKCERRFACPFRRDRFASALSRKPLERVCVARRFRSSRRLGLTRQPRLHAAVRAMQAGRALCAKSTIQPRFGGSASSVEGAARIRADEVLTLGRLGRESATFGTCLTVSPAGAAANC